MGNGQDSCLLILGSIEVRCGDSELVIEHRPRLIFVLLAIEAGHLLPDWRLIESLWGDDAPSTADSALRTYVSGARRMAESLGLTLRRRSGGYLVDGQIDSFD